jgi:hypothetical protein
MATYGEEQMRPQRVNPTVQAKDWLTQQALQYAPISSPVTPQGFTPAALPTAPQFGGFYNQQSLAGSAQGLALGRSSQLDQVAEPYKRSGDPNWQTNPEYLAKVAQVNAAWQPLIQGAYKTPSANQIAQAVQAGRQVPVLGERMGDLYGGGFFRSESGTPEYWSRLDNRLQRAQEHLAKVGKPETANRFQQEIDAIKLLQSLRPAVQRAGGGPIPSGIASLPIGSQAPRISPQIANAITKLMQFIPVPPRGIGGLI